MKHEAIKNSGSERSEGCGVLLVNLGSPDSTETGDVRRYLREFLSDDRVIDVPKIAQQALLNLFILPTRPAKSGEAYAKIWGDKGSPLVVMTYRVAELLGERIDLPIEVGMRYGNPSTEEAVRRLRDRGVRDLFVIPLYPHYAMSSYETAVAKTQDVAERIAPSMRVTYKAPYYQDERYIEALYQASAPYLDDGFDALLFSYHGIPERHIRKRDPSGCYCLRYADCCERPHPAHAICYRHQVVKTTRLFAERAGLSRERYMMSFQSRLGVNPWLKPYTDQEIEALPSRGVKRLAVICPAFVSDCLETLEEISMEARESFIDAGGHEFTYIPCMNDHEAWIDALASFVDEFCAGDRVDRPLLATENVERGGDARVEVDG